MKKKKNEDRVRHLYTRVQHLYNKDNIKNLHIDNIYNFVDTIRAFVGGILAVVLGIVTVLAVTTTRAMYYSNGRWTFGTVVFGGVVFVVVLALLVALIGLVINYFMCKSARENI